MEETKNISKYVSIVLFGLLLLATISLVSSVCIIFPVASKVDKNKNELLHHFMLIDREDVKDQLNKCRTFFNTMHDKDHVTQNHLADIDDDVDLDDKEIEGMDSKIKKRRSRKNKMHKKFSTNLITLSLKFLVVLALLLGYFLYSYIQSSQFLDVAIDLINESGTITLRQFSNNFLYQVMQEVLVTNGQAQVKNKDSLNYVFSYLNETIKEQEKFLKIHSNNAEHHSSSFNDFFDLL